MSPLQFIFVLKQIAIPDSVVGMANRASSLQPGMTLQLRQEQNARSFKQQ